MSEDKSGDVRLPCKCSVLVHGFCKGKLQKFARLAIFLAKLAGVRSLDRLQLQNCCLEDGPGAIASMPNERGSVPGVSMYLSTPGPLSIPFLS